LAKGVRGIYWKKKTGYYILNERDLKNPSAGGNATPDLSLKY
jgi:hypothetical protein